jgi:hypothetical protein
MTLMFMTDEKQLRITRVLQKWGICAKFGLSTSNELW